MARDLLTYDDTSVRIQGREPTTPTQPIPKYGEYWHEMGTGYESLWLTNTLMVSLQCIKQELNLDVDIEEQGALITCARKFEELFKEVKKDVIQDDSSGRRELRIRATPELGAVEFEVNPIIDVPARTGKRHPFRIQARTKAEFEPGPVEID